MNSDLIASMKMHIDVECEDYIEMNHAIEKLLYGSPEQRQYAAAYLSVNPLPSHELVAAMCGALADDDPVVREFIIMGLKEMDPFAAFAIPYLRERLRKCNIFEARLVFWTLCAIGKTTVVALPEVTAYLNSYDYQCRYLCVKLMGTWEVSHQSVMDLLKTSMNDCNHDVRALASLVRAQLERGGNANFKDPGRDS